MAIGDFLADNNQRAARPLERAREATDFMRGNARVLGLQLNDGQHADDTASLFGSFASTARPILEAKLAALIHKRTFRL